MTYLHDTFEVMKELCKSTGRWGMCINAYGVGGDDVEPEEVQKAAPYVDIDQALRLVLGEGAILLFDSEDECHAAYDATVGDDGPTKHNQYHGPARVYACTCSPDGELRSENT